MDRQAGRFFRGHQSTTRIAAAIGLGAIVGSYLVLKAFAWLPAPGDEFIYLYQGLRLSEGRLPYRDFFMAHPPLQTAVIALLFRITGGFSYTAAKVMPWAWCALSGVGVFLLAGGRWRGVLAAGLFLFGYDVLRSSTHATGVNQSVAFLVMAAWFMARSRPAVSGALAGLALLTRFYVLPGAGVLALAPIFVHGWSKGLKPALAYAASLAVVTVVVVGLFIALAGWTPVFDALARYHWAKPPMRGMSLDYIWSQVLYNNFTLFWAGALGSAMVGLAGLHAKARKRPIPPGLGIECLWALAALGQVATLGSASRVWMFYFYPAYPFLAILASRAFVDGIAAAGKRRKAGYAVLGVFLAGWIGHVLFMGPGLAKDDEGDVSKTYRFKPSPMPSFVNAAVKALFWRDERVSNRFYTVPTTYLWHESRSFEAIFDAAREVRSTCREGETLFGDSGTAPLVSMLSGCRLALDEADTNILRFRSGMTDPAAFMARVNERPPRFVFLRPRFGVAGLPQVVDMVNREYRQIGVYRRAGETTYLLFERAR